ncbi:MAG: hypothetical protein AB2L14_36625 [Candidatus Xenobiia bacterium LiM19]
MKRLNITLPDELVVELKKKPSMSHFIAEALREKIRRERMREIDAALIEGYKATASEDKRLNEEWEPATMEDKGW